MQPQWRHQRNADVGHVPDLNVANIAPEDAANISSDDAANDATFWDDPPEEDVEGELTLRLEDEADKGPPILMPS